jgi:hypothetical protein
MGGAGGASWVVKVHVKSAARGLPATSLTPLAPPFTVAVYVVPKARPEAAVGSRTADSVTGSHVTVAGTVWSAASSSTNVSTVTEAGASGSLKVAETFAPMGTEPSTGLVETTVGGVVSDAGVCAVNTTSTQ